MEHHAIALERRCLRSRLPDIEPASHDHQDVSAAKRQVGPAVSVTPDHAGAQRVSVRKHIHRHQRIHHRDTGRVDEPSERINHARGADAASYEKQRP